MNAFDKISNGWNIAMSSFKVLKEKKELVIFPILSSLSIMLIVGSFVILFISNSGWDSPDSLNTTSTVYYIILFVFYLVNYFIVVFFNMALIHCARLYFKGEPFTLRDGIRFSISRIGAIFSWACFAATIGLLLRVIQENVGIVGKIITGIVGVVWSIATFFVVPVIAYENVGPLDAVKRSAELMKKKWGESLGATFSFGLIQFIAILLAGLPLFFIGNIFDPIAGIALAIIGAFIMISIFSAAQTVFIAAVYHNIDGDLNQHFNKQMVDDLFEKKEKKWF